MTPTREAFTREQTSGLRKIQDADGELGAKNN
jgi:hypothetical protein